MGLATCWRCGQRTEKKIKHKKHGWTCYSCYKVECLWFHEKENYMTVFGGEISESTTSYGHRIKGFFVTCTKCGWHSKCDVKFKDEIGFKSIVLECGQCGNTHEMEIT